VLTGKTKTEKKNNYDRMTSFNLVPVANIEGIIGLSVVGAIHELQHHLNLSLFGFLSVFL
jgi:hypothetical protein